jgi:hypothetical protein
LCSARPRLSHLFQPSALLQTEEIPDKFTAPIPPPVMIDIGTKALAGRRVGRVNIRQITMELSDGIKGIAMIDLMGLSIRNHGQGLETEVTTGSRFETFKKGCINGRCIGYPVHCLR